MKLADLAAVVPILPNRITGLSGAGQGWGLDRGDFETARDDAGKERQVLYCKMEEVGLARKSGEMPISN